MRADGTFASAVIAGMSVEYDGFRRMQCMLSCLLFERRKADTNLA